MNLSRGNKGLVLVAVLWMVAVMMALVTVTGQTNRLNMKMTMTAVDEVRCKWACRAGTENAIAVLAEDLRDSDCLSDLWSENAETFTDIALERCRYSVRVIDEAGKLNINIATKDQLMALPYMEEGIAEAILDWRDQDDTPQAQGAEMGYYEGLPIPYMIRNGPLRTIRELLRIKGVTEELLYGEDTNLNGLLDYNERDGELSPPMDDGDDYLDEGWIAYLTCYSYENNVDAQGNRRININQADEKQLESGLGISTAQARWIVQNRGKGYQTIADLVSDTASQKPQSNAGGNQSNNAEPIDLKTFSQIADRITISSEEKILGKININTAPREVLTALFGGSEQAEQFALTVVADRAGLLYGFESIADLVSQESMSLESFKRIADLIAVRSDVFTIRCSAAGDVSGATSQTECVVDRSATPCTVLYWYQGANY